MSLARYFLLGLLLVEISSVAYTINFVLMKLLRIQLTKSEYNRIRMLVQPV